MKNVLIVLGALVLLVGFVGVIRYTYQQDQAYSRMVCTQVYGLDSNCHQIASSEVK